MDPSLHACILIAQVDYEARQVAVLLKAWSLQIQETLLQTMVVCTSSARSRFILIEHTGPGNMHVLAEKTEGAKSWEALRPVTVPMGPLSLFSLPKSALYQGTMKVS